jgi:hypothetical protein
MAEPPKFDGLIILSVFRRQSGNVPEQKYCMSHEKATYLIAALNEPAAHILHRVLTGATYEEAIEAR